MDLYARISSRLDTTTLTSARITMHVFNAQGVPYTMTADSATLRQEILGESQRRVANVAVACLLDELSLDIQFHDYRDYYDLVVELVAYLSSFFGIADANVTLSLGSMPAHSTHQVA